MRSFRSLLIVAGSALLFNVAHAQVIYNWNFDTPWSGTGGDKTGYGTGWGIRGVGGGLPNGSSVVGSGEMTYESGAAYGGREGGVAVVTNTSTDPANGVAFNLKLRDPSNPGDEAATSAFRTAFEQSVNKQYNPYVQVEIWDDGTAIVPNQTNIPDFGQFGLYTNLVESISTSGVRTNVQGQIGTRGSNALNSGVWNLGGWNTYRLQLDSNGFGYAYVNNVLVGSGSRNFLTLSDAFRASMGVFVNPGATKMVVDNFQFGVTPVPEPETYAMFLAGLGLMGAIAKRRKGKQA